MTTKLRDANLIPTNQPYNKAPWNYTGTETAVSMPADITDWVLIEIKNASGVTVQKKAALLKSNGTVIEADGSNLTSITLDSSITPGNYKFIVSHRNHLSVSSDALVSLTAGQSAQDFNSFDFTTNANVKAGNQTMLKPGVYGLRKGNIDGNNVINAQDRTILRSAVESVGVYSDFDLNLDGNFNSQDRAISRLEPDAIAIL